MCGDILGLSPVRTVKPPHVGESGFSMECELMHWYDIASDNGDPANTVIIGRIRMMHVVSTLIFQSPALPSPYIFADEYQKEAMLEDPKAESPMINPEKLRPVSRLGGITYARSTQYVPSLTFEVLRDEKLTWDRFMEVPRPRWDEVKDTPDVKASLEKPAKTVE